jgi:hypothetical protein
MTEIQWRLRKQERHQKSESEWKRHSIVIPSDAEELVRHYNDSNTFFEYRAVTLEEKPPAKPQEGPVVFSFKRKGKGPGAIKK